MRFRAMILDLDGVIADTAPLHARAWKVVFDDLLRRRAERDGGAMSPFDETVEYRRYVDGRPRGEGARAFLAARDIEFAEGDDDDAPGAETIHGIARRKNELYRSLLAERGVRLHEDAADLLARGRARGLRLAVVTSSRNGSAVLESLGLRRAVDVALDGAEAARLGLPGKPAPETFLEAARRLGADPAQTIVVEDAEAGVQAARRGGFGLVVGIDRGSGGGLARHGADLVLTDLRELDLDDPRGPRSDDLERAARSIIAALGDRRPVLFLDYDGTLTPIVSRPEQAILAEPMRDAIRIAAAAMPVAIVSGRDRPDVQRLVGLEQIVYAGSHGFDIAGPGGLHREHEGGAAAREALAQARAELERDLASIEGAQLEPKRFALAVHFRNVAPQHHAAVERAVDEAVRRHAGLRRTSGKMVWELRPDLPWDKGRAVLWLLEALQLDGPKMVPVYIGDDVTDEDAFVALRDRGVTVRVGGADEPTAAQHHLPDVEAVGALLREIARRRSEI